MSSVSFALFTCDKMLCSNVIVQRQFLCPLRMVSDPPEMPFQVLTPIDGLTGFCTAITPCRTATANARYQKLLQEWQDLHATRFSRRKPRVAFQSRHTPPGPQVYEPSIATVLLCSDHCERSFDIPSDLVFIPTQGYDTIPDSITKILAQFVSTLFSDCFIFNWFLFYSLLQQTYEQCATYKSSSFNEVCFRRVFSVFVLSVFI